MKRAGRGGGKALKLKHSLPSLTRRRALDSGFFFFRQEQEIKAIEVERLSKAFHTKRKAAGFRASPRALVPLEIQLVEALRELSIAIEEGGLLGFIAPNEAGKSTTIKILTGILHPSGGQARVLGLVPWQERTWPAFQLGSVFGQRPQLWYHLPGINTFLLFGEIYEVERRTLRCRIEELAEIFAIGNLLDITARKLSLGQRMRCEVAASLLRRPRLILLDEPSIGLDVVAKQRLRQAIQRLTEQEGVSVLLTSHDAGDIVALCRRVIIVNLGQIVFDEQVAALKELYLRTKHVEAR